MAAFFRIVRTITGCILLLIGAVLTLPVANDVEDWPVAVGLGAPTVLAGVLVLLRVRRDRKRAQQEEGDEREVALLRLAASGDGELTATELAARLGWPMETAVATLRSVEDGVRITSTLTQEGVLLFQFREVMHDPTRVPADPPAEPPSRPAAILAPEEHAAG